MFGWIGAGPGRGPQGGWVAVVATTALLLTWTATATASPTTAPKLIAHRYIVVLHGRLPSKPTKHSEHVVTTLDRRVAASVHAKPLFLYDAGIRGFAAYLTRKQLRKLRHDPRVKSVEQDALVREDAVEAQANPLWGLDRIDQRSRPADLIYHYPSTGGAGVTAYVIDTGIQADHPDFGARGSFAENFADDTKADGNGHGTHVAGIIGGTRYSVAKQVTLVGVKVLTSSGYGTASSVIAGIDWVANHAVAHASVANLSLGARTNPTIDAATAQLVREGVFVVAAAGNSNRDACSFSPARVPSAFTVGATAEDDTKATFSNHGSCLDDYAPGHNIPSDWIGSAAKTISGTSMAAPYVAGVAALYLAAHPSTPAQVTTWLNDHATLGVVAGNPAGTPNRFFFAGGY